MHACLQSQDHIQHPVLNHHTSNRDKQDPERNGGGVRELKERKGIGRMRRNESLPKGGRTGKAVTEPVQQRSKRKKAKMGVNERNKVTHT